MALGKSTAEINSKKLKLYDVEYQPGISSIQGIGNMMFINRDPFKVNLAMLKGEVQITLSDSLESVWAERSGVTLDFATRKFQNRVRNSNTTKQKSEDKNDKKGKALDLPKELLLNG